MRSQQAALSPGRANLALATLSLGTFVMGSAELLVVGLLNLIAIFRLPTRAERAS